MKKLCRHNVLSTGFLAAAAVLTPGLGMADTVGMFLNPSGEAVTFDADTDSVLGSVAVSGGSYRDCAITSDGTTGFATNFAGTLHVVDVTTVPPTLAGAPNPIAISNNGEDVAMAPGGQFALASDGSAPQPLSVVDIASQTEVSTQNITGLDHNSVAVCANGTVLTSSSTLGVFSASLDGSGNLTATGDSLSLYGVNNVHCAPGSAVGVAVTRGGEELHSFSLPGLATLDSEPLADFGLGAAFNGDGSVVFVVSVNAVRAYELDPVTGQIGAQAWSISNGPLSTPYGVEQIAVHPDGSKLYVRNGNQVRILDPETGGDLGVLSEPIGTNNGICFAEGISADVENIARFKVTKMYHPPSMTDEVEVTLTCNSGLPLKQSFTIAGGDPNGVTFVVTELPEDGATCEVTESGGPANYTPEFNGGEGCKWSGVGSGFRTCEIVNHPEPAEYTVTKVWEFTEDSGFEEDDYDVYVEIDCDGSSIMSANTGSFDGDMWSGYLGDNESVTVTVDTMQGAATCSAAETDVYVQSGVEVSYDGDCVDAALPAGGSASCTITNTVFFEGIPTLSQYGLALLALLMLGVGLMMTRRFG